MTAPSLVLVGAAGWLHPAWRNGFYPDGLPDDWLLSYYNTQFQAVYLPAAVWQAATEATWAQWLDDTQDGFYFVLEPGDAPPAHPASPRVLLASAGLGGGACLVARRGAGSAWLAQRITQQAATGEPLFVFSRSGNLALLEQASTLKQVMGY